MRENLKQKIDEFLTRGVSEIVNREHLKGVLLSGKKLRVKLGIDPTSPNLHIGRAVTLLKMKDLQDMGHKIIFIIGDFTAVIGDTSDKDSERPMLDEKTVKNNLRSYKIQVGKILDLKRTKILFNSKWLKKLGYMEIGRQADQFSLSEFIARENIKKRLKEGKRISLRELQYPLMQGYDSVAVKADLEIGGTDQRFNLLAGRQLQKLYGQKQQDIVMVNLIEGTDGRKMSSSWGNTVNLTDSARDMFGKIMSIPDNLITKYFIHCTRVSMGYIEEIEKNMRSEKLNPRDAKLSLAFEITKIYHGKNEALKARKYFVKAFSEKKIPYDVAEVTVKEGEKITSIIVNAGQAKSLSEARRKMEQGGVEIDGQRIKDWKKTINAAMKDKVIKIGKFGFIKIKI